MNLLLENEITGNDVLNFIKSKYNAYIKYAKKTLIGNRYTRHDLNFEVDGKFFGHLGFYVDENNNINIKDVYRNNWKISDRGKGILTSIIKDLIIYAREHNGHVFAINPDKGFWIGRLGWVMVGTDRAVLK